MTEEDWAPELVDRYDKLLAERAGPKQYTAFLRAAFKTYSIPARPHFRWRKNKRGSEKHCALGISYDGSARTMKEMKERFDEVREIAYHFSAHRLGIEYDGTIVYHRDQVWERDERNGAAYLCALMCVGKGAVPYLPVELREAVLDRM